MENRENVVAEYFKLRVMLNKANALRNESSELMFEIRGFEEHDILWATLKGVSRPQGLELCRKKQRRKWSPSNFTGLTLFEKFCSTYLNEHFSTNNNSAKAAERLARELGSLGLSS